MQSQGSATKQVAQPGENGAVVGVRYLSELTCVNKTIEWAGQLSVTVMTPVNTPVPGIMVRAS